MDVASRFAGSSTGVGFSKTKLAPSVTPAGCSKNDGRFQHLMGSIISSSVRNHVDPRELAVVLEPAEELIQVDPSELRFPFLPNEMMSALCSIKVVNVTDNYVVFITMSRAANVAGHPTSPNRGILPPRSTQELFVRRIAKKSVAQSIECDDKYIICSTTVSESFSNSQYGSDLDKFYYEQAGQIWHRRELAVVLYPAYQQGSPDGMPHTEVSSPYSSMGNELIQVDPNELRFPFLPNEMLSASSSIKVVNVTDNYVVFITTSPGANVAEHPTSPYRGILLPRSTKELFVRRTAKKSVAQSIECDDKYIICSTTVSESFSNSQYGSNLDKFYSEQVGQIWHIRELGVVLYPAYQQGSPDELVELIQVDPNELRFPFLPNEMLSASSSIKVVNVTDNYVVFITKSTSANVAEYPTSPNRGILPPRSTQELFVRRTSKKSIAQSMECDDKFILYSTTVSESFSNSKYGCDLDKFYHEEAGQIWHRRDLGVVLYPAYQQESPDSVPHTEVSSPTLLWTTF
ncbi:vesicle-associated protein 1-4-like [Triticum urartu]|uniref:vesicle-associated protein 1-4-like n=1 Tax=Triticum urartu TaxID=4572 RepID=UPI0020433D22|nr:vesicle-associated protein 1-4-like [Triticum urartu]